MPALGSPSLDQLRVFLAVVDAGSFSAAAHRLNRRQSVVSYSIANLERHLGGLRLFDRSSRKPTLTEAGKTLLSEARKVAHGIDGLRAKATGLLAGLEPELAVAIDVMLPTARLVSTLVAFRTAFPTVNLRLYIEALGAVARLVLDRTCAIGASAAVARSMDDLDQRRIGSVRMLSVAAPSHPLAGWRDTVPVSEARSHIQLVLTDRSDLTQGKDFNVLSTETWRLGDLGAKHELLRAGVGWGGMPEALIKDDLASGRLVELDIEGRVPDEYQIYAVHRTDSPPGPAGRWFLTRLADASEQPEAQTKPEGKLASAARTTGRSRPPP